jgi:hypothetical protein
VPNIDLWESKCLEKEQTILTIQKQYELEIKHLNTELESLKLERDLQMKNAQKEKQELTEKNTYVNFYSISLFPLSELE